MLTYHDALVEYRCQLRGWKRSLERDPDLGKLMPYHTEQLELAVKALEMAEEKEKEDKMRDWIKPSDKMPDTNQNVIICRMYDADTPIVEQGHWEGPVGDWWKVYGTRVKTKNILYWMPMPEPPKGD